jgi:hypothetical protein
LSVIDCSSYDFQPPNPTLMTRRLIIVAVIALFKTPSLLAQETDSLKVDSAAINISLAPTPASKTSNIVVLRGTILPYLIGNDMGIATSVGVEYIFLKHHSIGIDGFLHLTYGGQDNLYDTAGVFYKTGSHHHSSEKAIFINYRYYFNPKNLQALRGVTAYISPYFRYGYSEEHNDPQFNVNYILQKEHSSSEGILLGLVGPIDKNKRCKFDVNAGPFKKRKDITTVYLEDHVEKTRSEHKKTVGLRIGVFFTYLIY